MDTPMDTPIPSAERELLPLRVGASSAGPSLRVVVVSYNTRALTGRCLSALCRSDLEGLEVCVVDNASRDGSVEALRNFDPRVEVLALEKNVGFGAANNRGIGNSNAPFFALVNSDALVEEDTREKLRAYLCKHPRVGIVGPRLRNADGSPQRCWFAFPSPVRAWLENLGLCRVAEGVKRALRGCVPLQSGPVDWVSGACLLVRREVWIASGGFDEQFFLYSEETDWQRRVRDLGWEIHGVAEAAATHVGGASGAAFSETARDFFWEGVDRYFRAHHGMRGVLALRAATAVGAAVRGVGCLVASDWRRAGRWGRILRRQCTRPVPRGGRRWSVWAGGTGG
jgi:GT2 family glycosyltransferase